MDEKILGEIIGLKLNTSTYHNVTVTPSLINFFYGKNGVGKSTIGREINANRGITWKDGKSESDFSVLVYNDDFIKRNFANYGAVSGIFTIGEDDKSAADKIKELEDKKSTLGDEYRSAKKLRDEKIIDQEKTTTSFKKSVFDSSDKFRNNFQEAMKGKRGNVDVFVPELLKQTKAVEHDFDELKNMSDTAFDKTSTFYRRMQSLDKTLLAPSSLFEKSIVSSSNTSFAQFVKKYQTSDWVHQGHEKFPETDGKCPYCQQVLPPSFEQDIKSAFDEQYQIDMDALGSFKNSYSTAISSIKDTLEKNASETLSKLDLSEYNAVSSQLIATLSENQSIIDRKIKEPATPVALKDVASIIDHLDEIIANLNAVIDHNNAIVNEKPKKKTECITKVWELIYFSLKPQVDAYQTSMTSFQQEITKLEEQMNDLIARGNALKIEIQKLSTKNTNTTDSVKAMNTLLKDSGFQGFRIKENKQITNTYKIVREDDSIAENLSEGEQNFIAFLYFYHLVHGSKTEDGTNKPKIVVIDDPVSSMDSGALFIVSALTREMIEICRNNAASNPTSENDYIKQIFVLTHNSYFHNDVTANMVKYWDYVAFFKIVKANNHSEVIPCIEDVLAFDGTTLLRKNIDPVQNGYHALWTELKEVNSPIAVTHIIHQILNHYFIQICSYNGGTVRDKILSENISEFIETDENGNESYKPDYYIVQGLLSYLVATQKDIIDGSQFIDNAGDPNACKLAFKKIFDIMGQDQHYAMMMGTN
ncbi:AAA family ATPase [Enterococcus pseudoavium]|uniref:AAA family ATPase n=1 Tax=Enterococcus TaxID=1350 RepID=UPI00082F3F1C|nr:MULTISPECIES: AAA family ATPase [Enterococcus]RGC48133.1 hypothetical protein DXA88_04075 [Enterococcus gallinarum]